MNDEDFSYQYDSNMKIESNEEVMQGLEKILNGLTLEDVWKMKFNSIEEAEEFYNLLPNITRFVVRKNDVERDKNQNIISHKWVCSK